MADLGMGISLASVSKLNVFLSKLSAGCHLLHKYSEGDRNMQSPKGVGFGRLGPALSKRGWYFINEMAQGGLSGFPLHLESAFSFQKSQPCHSIPFYVQLLSMSWLHSPAIGRVERGGGAGELLSRWRDLRPGGGYKQGCLPGC